MGYAPHHIQHAAEIAKAAVSSGEKAGIEALNHPDEVAKLLEVVAAKLDALAK